MPIVNAAAGVKADGLTCDGPCVCVCQVVVSEKDEKASKSEVRQVALSTAKTGVSQLVTPRKPFPLHNSRLEKFMLWLDWTRTFNQYVVISNSHAQLLPLGHFMSRP